MNICKRLFGKYRGINEYSISYKEVKEIMNKNKDAILIDVRSPQEYKEGHLEKSINISLYDIERGNYDINNKNKTIILCCQYGKRSKKAMQILRKNGYTNVYQLEGGLENL